MIVLIAARIKTLAATRVKTAVARRCQSWINANVKPLILIVASGLLLTACGFEQTSEATPEARAALVSRAQTLLPTDTKLAEIYQRSCVSCHAVPSSTAPLTGDHTSWEPRLAKGMDTLLDNVINGMGGMPPLGLCMDCDMQQFEDLILFMGQTH
jgi:cytochrome c5